MTKLDQYLDELQTKALRASGLIEGALILEIEGSAEARNAARDILEVVAPMVNEIQTELDSVNRPEVEQGD